jgi:hypothetical protein
MEKVFPVPALASMTVSPGAIVELIGSKEFILI